MRALDWLLVCVPAAIVLHLVGAGATLVFLTSAAALIPVSALLGKATVQLGTHLGPRLGGLLNVTLGNAAELIIAIAAIRAGLPELVKASVSGSILGNLLLVLGVSLLVGGLRHGRQSFDAGLASASATMMTIAVIALAIPAVFSTGPHRIAGGREWLSMGVAVVLMAIYVLYVVYTVFGGKARRPAEGRRAEWSVGRAAVTLVGAAAAAAVLSELLVGVVEPVGEAWGLTQLFLGVMIMPLVGNVAEQWTAIAAAARDDMDLSLAISTGSCVQVALFVAPILVFVSAVLGRPLLLQFNAYELAALAGADAVAMFIALAGESNWLEGAQLLAVYLIVGIGFFFLA